MCVQSRLRSHPMSMTPGLDLSIQVTHVAARNTHYYKFQKVCLLTCDASLKLIFMTPASITHYLTHNHSVGRWGGGGFSPVCSPPQPEPALASKPTTPPALSALLIAWTQPSLYLHFQPRRQSSVFRPQPLAAVEE